MRTVHEENGVILSPFPLLQERPVTIVYRGALAQGSEGNDIYLHSGYGTGEWKEITDLPMVFDPRQGWVLTIPVTQAGIVSFCFRDGDGRWDNNAGANWQFEVLAKEMSPNYWATMRTAFAEFAREIFPNRRKK